MYSESGLKFLSFRSWLWSLACFYKVQLTGFSKYLFDLIPFSSHGYITCNVTKFTHFYCRTAAFNYFYLPYVISEWNKLSLKYRSCKNYLSFRNKLLKPGQPYLFKSKVLKILSCLRLSLNHLNALKFQHKFESCLKESVIPFFLYCHHCSNSRTTRIGSLNQTKK